MKNRFIAAAITAVIAASLTVPAFAAAGSVSGEIPAAAVDGAVKDGSATTPAVYEGEVPLLTPEEEERLDRYVEYLAGMEEEDQVQLAEDEGMTFNQYLADYNYNYNCYNLYKNEFTSPYRSFAETKMESPVYQGLLAAWRIATFQLSDVTSYSSKEVGFYEAILFDVLYQGADIESLSGMAKDQLDTIQASSLKKVADFLGQDISTFIMTDLDALSSEEFDKLVDAFDSCEELEDIFGAIGSVTKVFGYVNTVEELIYKLAKAQVIAENANETAKILLAMKGDTSNEALKAALDNMILICEENASETTALEVFGSELAINELVKWSLDKSWDMVLDTLGLYGIAVSAGQAAGKTLVNWLFSTEEDVELYYTLCALYEFEDTLKETLSSYESSYLSSRSNSASVTFNEAYKLLLQTHLFGMKVSKQYMDMLYKNGLINELLFSFREDEYNEYAESMDNITHSIEGIISNMTVIAYDAYLRDCCEATAPVLNINPKLKTEEEKAELEEYIHEEIELQKILSYSMNNLHIDDSIVLQDDIQTYGSVYMESGTLDLNGHTLEVGGEFLQEGGTVNINNGSLIIHGDYRMQERVFDSSDNSVSYENVYSALVMEKDSDYLEVGGGFYFQSWKEESLTNGTIKLLGDFAVIGYNFGSSDNCKFIIDGEGEKRFTFDNLATLNQLSYSGNSTVTVSGKLALGTLNSNIPLISDGMVLAGLDNGNKYTLSVTGDMELDGDADLNGGKLLVSGEVMHTGGTLTVNNGSVVIGGDYRMQERVVDESDGSVSYEDVYSALVMEKGGDYLEVGGDFCGQSWNSGTTLENGMIVLRGDFSELESGHYDTSGLNTLVFDGDGRQDISTVSSSIDFANVVITNTRGPVVFDNETNVTGSFRQPGGGSIIGAGNLFLDDEAMFVDRTDRDDINAYAGNADGVTPTYKDAENYDNGTPVKGESFIYAKSVLYSADGRRILSPPEGEAFVIETQLARARITSGEEMIIAAVYDEEGELLGMYSVPVENTALPVSRFDIPAQDTAIGTLKLFIWDGFETMQPLMDGEVVFSRN